MLAEDAERAITELDLDPHAVDDNSTRPPASPEQRSEADQHTDAEVPDNRSSDGQSTRAGASRHEEPPVDVCPAVTPPDDPREATQPTRDRQNDRGDNDDRGAGNRGPDDVVLEPAPPDIRETSAPDPTERSDPHQRRLVPLPDEAAATVERARLALAEIEQRRAAESAEQARAAENPPDDEYRNELDRWTHHDDPWGHHDGRADRGAPDRDDDADTVARG
jgi:hypothetical protein